MDALQINLLYRCSGANSFGKFNLLIRYLLQPFEVVRNLEMMFFMERGKPFVYQKMKMSEQGREASGIRPGTPIVGDERSPQYVIDPSQNPDFR